MENTKRAINEANLKSRLIKMFCVNSISSAKKHKKVNEKVVFLHFIKKIQCLIIKHHPVFSSDLNFKSHNSAFIALKKD